MMHYLLYLSKTPATLGQPRFFVFPSSVERDLFVKGLAYIKTNPRGRWSRDFNVEPHSEGTLAPLEKGARESVLSKPEDQAYWDDRFGDYTKGGNMKFISFRRRRSEETHDRITVLMSPHIDHDQLGSIAMGKITFKHRNFALGSPVTAGFIDQGYHCFGKSVMLKLGCDDMDSAILAKQFSNGTLQ